MAYGTPLIRRGYDQASGRGYSCNNGKACDHNGKACNHDDSSNHLASNDGTADDSGANDSGADDSRIIEALEYIHSHYSEKITVDTLVQICKTSRPTFNRHFKRIVGKTPVRYILDCRINAAKDLLAAGNLSKTEIAYRCGFYDVSHMDKNISE